MPFIVFEGGEAAGKTTQIDLLMKFFCTLPDLRAEQTREPGGTPLAEGIRALFKAKHPNDEPLPETEAFLVMAARAQHVRKRLRPALEKGLWVISDRYLDSSYVYQHFAAGLPRPTIESLASLAIDGLVPDLTLVLTLDPEEARSRARRRPGPLPLTAPQQPNALAVRDPAAASDAHVAAMGDRNDAQDESFFLRIHEGFERLVREAWPYPGGLVPRRVAIDARGSPDEVFKRIRAALRAAFPHDARLQSPI